MSSNADARSVGPLPSGQRARGVAVRLTAAMLVAAVLPLALIATATFNLRSEQLRDAALEELRALANIQEARVEAFVEASHATARLVASRTQLRRNVVSLLDGDASVLADVGAILDDARASTEGIGWIGLVGPDGRFLTASGPDGGEAWRAHLTIIEASDPPPAAWTVVPVDDVAALSVAVPMQLDERPLGVMVARLDLQPLVDLALDYEGLGDSGETFLAQRLPDGSAQFITPLRFDPGAQLRTAIASDATEVPMTTALAREETVLDDGLDYRGEPVFAATRYLPEVDWGLVVKIDRAEALAGVASLRALLLAAGAVSVLLAAAIAVVLSRSLTRPLAELEQVVLAMEDGDLARRADTTASGEIGALAASFNRMADAVAASHDELESTVAQRTLALERSVRELEHRNQELDAFASVVAHDLRAPLAVIVGVVEAIQAGLVTDAQQIAALMDSAARSGARMDALIGELLELARAGSETLETAEVILDDLVRDVVGAMDLEEVVTVRPLPTIYGDARSLGQVFQNLIANAAKYTAPDTEPRVVVEAQDVDDLWVITVDDNGVGIPAAERDAVFQPFTRGTATRDKDGTGVGLAIVARVVQQHGGQVAAADSDLGGTRMVITLPRHLTGSVDGSRRS